MPRRKFETVIQLTNLQSTHGQHNELVSIDAGTNKINIGARIKELRTFAHFTQSELAEKIGITKSAIANWETGRTRPDFPILPALCHALHISFDELLGNERLSNDKEYQLLANFRQMNAAHQKAVFDLSNQLLVAEQQLNKSQPIYLEELLFSDDPVAAGIGGADFSSQCRTVYIHSSPTVRRADYIFRVNGSSMEPTYPEGSYVLVQKKTSRLDENEIGIFQVHNDLYIKEYRKEGLVSHNPRFPLMRADDLGDVYTIGQVIGKLDERDFATDKEIEAFKQH